jgi:hypothetical protein
VEERPEAGGGFTVLDGAALVIGAAVASVHIRGAVPAESLGGVGWALLWITLSGVAVTAAGPFVFLARRYWRRPADYPRLGDWLWLLLGLPWLATAALRTGSPRAGPSTLYVGALGLGTLVASIAALVAVWKTWVMVPPDDDPDGPRPHWTERLGLVLAVAWPLQCGFAMVIGGNVP